MDDESKKFEGELGPKADTLKPGDMLRVNQGVYLKRRNALTSRALGRANPRTTLMILKIKKRRVDGDDVRYWLQVVGNDSKTGKQVIGWFCYSKQGYRTVRIGSVTLPTAEEIDSAIDEGVVLAKEQQEATSESAS